MYVISVKEWDLIVDVGGTKCGLGVVRDHESSISTCTLMGCFGKYSHLVYCGGVLAYIH